MSRKMLLVLLGMMVALPVASATVNETGESQPCPPDMMCVMDEPSNESANETHPSGKPGVCGAEVNCAGSIKPSAGGNGTCMDGQQGNETCDPDVYYFGGGPADSGPADAQSHSDAPLSAEQDPRSVPAAGAVVLLAAGAIALVALRRR